MKKYVYLFLATTLLIGVIIASGYMINGSVPEAEVIVLAKHSEDNTISASGKLQYRSGKQVKVPSAGIMADIMVKNGDTVKKDDPLFSYYKIDDAYTALISQYSGLESMDAIIGAASKYGSSADIINELKKYCPLETVTSEYEGKAADIKYGRDELFEKNALVMKISEKQTLEIPVNINETYISGVKKGQKAVVHFNAVPEKTFTGTVTKISDEAAVTSGLTGRETTVEVIITLDGKDDRLRAGYSAACTIKLSTDKDVLVLPYDIIRTDENGDYVFIARDGTAAKRYITADKEYKDGIRVSEGLSQGECVIVNSEGMYDGQKITIIKRRVQTND